MHAKAGVRKPFVCAGLLLFAPQWAGVKAIEVDDESDEATELGKQLAKCMGLAVGKKDRKLMTLSQWRPAWDRFVSLCD